MKKRLQSLALSILFTGSFLYGQAQVTTNFSGTLTTAQSFTRPRAIGDNINTQPESFYTRQLAPTDMEAGVNTYNYFVQALVPQVSGSYSITISSATLTDGNNDTFLILYSNNFNPATPLANLTAANDDISWGSSNLLSHLPNVSLSAGTTYYIVVTTYESGSTGPINFSASGPGSVLLPTLPVTWLGFTATKQGKSVELNWSTATEENTKVYVVQHSVDGRDWTSLATVNAAGYSSVIQRYSYVDRFIVSDANYYRLIQRDLDGKENYSRVVAVNFSDVQQQLRLYPNPVTNGELMIKLVKEARVELYNAAGVLVQQKQLPPGLHQLSLQHLPKGRYTIKAGEETKTIMLQ